LGSAHQKKSQTMGTLVFKFEQLKSIIDRPQIQGPHEGTGTRTDYLVNRDDQKNERPFGQKKCTKIEK